MAVVILPDFRWYRWQLHCMLYAFWRHCYFICAGKNLMVAEPSRSYLSTWAMDDHVFAAFMNYISSAVWLILRQISPEVKQCVAFAWPANCARQKQWMWVHRKCYMAVSLWTLIRFHSKKSSAFSFQLERSWIITADWFNMKEKYYFNL